MHESLGHGTRAEKGITPERCPEIVRLEDQIPRAGSSGASLPRSTIIAIAVGVAGGVVLVGIIVLLSMLW